MRARTLIGVGLIACVAALPVRAQDASPAGGLSQKLTFDRKPFLPPWNDDLVQLTPLLLSVPQAPHAVRASDGRYHLVYELRMHNYGSSPETRPTAVKPPASLQITEVAVFADGAEQPALSLVGASLASRMQLVRIGVSPPPAALLEAQTGIVFLDVVFPDRQSVPRRVTNRVTVAPVPNTGNVPELKVTTLEVDVDRTPVVVLGPFLRGGVWANFNGCCDFLAPHRRVGRSIDGKEYYPERFAVDVLKVEPVGGQLRLYQGDGNVIEQWYTLNADIISAADGVVTRVVKGLANDPIGVAPYPPTVALGGGNEVIVYIGDGIYLMYGHMMPGSVTAHVGDRVRRGDVLGRLGNTGQSTAPHLHFQVTDANSIGTAQGIPWVMDEFTLLGTFEDIDDTGALTGVQPANQLRARELPLQQTIFRFK